MKSTLTDSWHRQKNETAKAYKNFEIYRDLGPDRSIQKVSKKLSKNKVSLARQSAKYEWVARARDFDEDMSKAILKASKNQAIAMRESQFSEARELQKLAHQIVARAAKLAGSKYPDSQIMKLVLEFTLGYVKSFGDLVHLESEAIGYLQERLQPSADQDTNSEAQKDNEGRPELKIVNEDTMVEQQTEGKKKIKLNRRRR